jgi:hypothetical protein
MTIRKLFFGCGFIMLIINPKKDARAPRTNPLGIWGAYDDNAAYLAITLPIRSAAGTPLASVWSSVEGPEQEALRNSIIKSGRVNWRAEKARCNSQTGGVPSFLRNKGDIFWAVRRTKSPSGGLVDPDWYDAMRASWYAPNQYSTTNNPDVARPSHPEEGWASIVVASWDAIVGHAENLMISGRDQWSQDKDWKKWLGEAMPNRIMLSLMSINDWDFSPSTVNRLLTVNDRLSALVRDLRPNLLSSTILALDFSLWGPGLAPSPAERAMLDRNRLLAVVADRVDPTTGELEIASSRRPRKL